MQLKQWLQIIKNTENVKFSTGVLEHSDVNLKLDMAKNPGDIKYTNLDDNGFTH